MSPTIPTAPFNLGFLTILQESNGFLGGYLVTNQWGRPLEFRLSTAVQPNRIQQILYGDKLRGYVCADLIGKALVEKATTAVQCLLTDCEAVLDLRLRMDTPIGCLTACATDPVRCHPCHAGDLPIVLELRHRLEGIVDLTEPFSRIREAVGEARKMGVTRGG